MIDSKLIIISKRTMQSAKILSTRFRSKGFPTIFDNQLRICPERAQERSAKRNASLQHDASSLKTNSLIVMRQIAGELSRIRRTYCYQNIIRRLSICPRLARKARQKFMKR